MTGAADPDLTKCAPAGAAGLRAGVRCERTEREAVGVRCEPVVWAAGTEALASVAEAKLELAIRHNKNADRNVALYKCG